MQTGRRGGACLKLACNKAKCNATCFAREKLLGEFMRGMETWVLLPGWSLRGQ